MIREPGCGDGPGPHRRSVFEKVALVPAPWRLAMNFFGDPHFSVEGFEFVDPPEAVAVALPVEHAVEIAINKSGSAA